MQITEGFMPYKGYQTYYRIVGERSDTQAPLVLLHGGPGSTHNYFEVLDELADSGRQLIMYDQLGCGQSATPARPDLWTSATWIEELIALREHLKLTEIHLLGQSWGGMMAIEYLCDYQPTGIKSAILSSTLPSAKLWAQEQHRMIALMTESEQAAIKDAEARNDYSQPAYIAANDHYMVLHCTDVPNANSPEPLRRKKISGTESYLTAWGPNEYTPSGTLKNWEYRDKLSQIQTPTLITSGTDDLCTPLVAKTMFDGIKNAHWDLYAHSRHMPFVDEHEKYLPLLTAWLAKND